jgi:hypothetical protein
MPSLSLKASINYPFVGPSGPSYDPDAANWFTRVESAGGAITLDNKTAFNTAFLSLKSTLVVSSASVKLWDHVGVGYFLMGQESFTNGVFVPFYGNGFNYTNYGPIAWNPATNVNYVAGDYNKFTGLIGDGATKYIQVDQLPNSATGSTDLWYSQQRMGYTYKDCQYTDTITKNVPFGCNATRPFTMGFDSNPLIVGRFSNGARNNNSATSTSMSPVLVGTDLPTGYRGVGMLRSAGALQGGFGIFSVGGNIISQNLNSAGAGGVGAMRFGNGAQGYDQQRTACAIFGKGFSTNQTNEVNDFKSLNTIMETLRTSLI